MCYRPLNTAQDIPFYRTDRKVVHIDVEKYHSWKRLVTMISVYMQVDLHVLPMMPRPTHEVR